MKRGRTLAAAAAVTIALVLLSSPGAFAQSADDGLFDGRSDALPAPSDVAKDIAGSTLETSKTVTLGGDVSLIQSLDLRSGKLSQTRGLKAQNLGLFVDARPSEDFRFHGRGQYTMDGASMTGVFSVQELFADFSYGRRLRLRAGKQVANWGVGLWWSPADILSLTPIDQSDPSAARQGPVALKLSTPMGLDQLSAYATTQDSLSIDQVGFAGRYEFVIGDSEFALGGYWRKDGTVRPRIVGTGTARFLGLDWYGEAVGSFGSETRLARFGGSLPGGYETYAPGGLLFQGAAGFAWADRDGEGRWNLAAAGEYYFNGRGAEDAAAYAGHRELLLSLAQTHELGADSLAGYGGHYAGANVSAEDLWSSKLGVAAEWRSNLSDSSGFARGVAAYEPVADFRLEAGCVVYYGPDGSEYTSEVESLDLGSTGAAAYAVASLRLWARTTLDIAYPFIGDGARPRLTLVFSGQF
jgi:hypothetical protein